MSPFEIAIMVVLVALTTMFTRFVPFLAFKSDVATPKYLEYLGRTLPPAVFGMLVVYCLRSIDILSSPFGIPELIGVLTVVVLHLLFRRMLVSITVGTGVYLILVNLVFV